LSAADRRCAGPPRPWRGSGEAWSAPETTALIIDVDGAQMIEMRERASTVFVANPDIADVQVPASTNGSQILVFGKKAGSTTVFALTRGGIVRRFAVTVQRPVAQIMAALNLAAPSARIKVSSTPNGLDVTGEADSPRDAQQLKSAAKEFLKDKETLSFNVGVVAATQVNLKVRIAEVSRTADKEFGFNWSALSNSGSVAFGLLTGRAPVSTMTNTVTGALTSNFGDFSRSTDGLDSVGLGYKNASGKVNISGLIDALATEGLVTVLAEPNLTAISGESASFLAGGEFPVPVPQGLQQITIEWKRYGVSLDFTPTVLTENRISIKVRPEVSELTTTGQVVIDGTTIPGLAVRRAETTIELASGQSFAIAGLFQNNAANQVQSVPWLGDIPILGALLRSTSFQHNESELVIIVTPYIVRPVARASDLHLPTEGVVYANDMERVLLGRLTSRHPSPSANPTNTPHLQGDAGFILER
jgi:pilus assembly protein CpaC